MPVDPAAAARLEPTVSFGSSPESDATTSSGQSRFRMFVGGAVIAIAAIGYALYAQHMLAAGPVLPELPPGPEKAIGAPAGVLPVPSEDEVQLLLNTMRFFNSGGSSQLPDNRH